jgi:tRNA G37 N-methylase Trm5
LKKKLKELLSESLPREELSNVYGSYDIGGDIPIIRLTSASEKNAAKIADALMSVHGNVKTVLAQTSSIAGEFRLRRLTHIPSFYRFNYRLTALER